MEINFERKNSASEAATRHMRQTMCRNPLRSLRHIVPAAAPPDVLRYADSAHQSAWQNPKKNLPPPVDFFELRQAPGTLYAILPNHITIIKIPKK